MRPLRILLVSTPFIPVPPTTYGGLERVVYDLAYSLKELGQEVSVACPRESKLPEGVGQVDIGPAKYRVQQNWNRAEFEAYQVYKPHLKNFDIIHDHSVHPDTCVVLRRGTKVRVTRIGPFIDGMFLKHKERVRTSGASEFLTISGYTVHSMPRTTLNPRWSSIYAISRHRFEGKLLTLTLVGGDSVTTTPGHNLFIWDTVRKKMKLQPANSILDQYVVTPSELPMRIPERPGISDANLVFLGLWVGDGCFDRPYRRYVHVDAANDSECRQVFRAVADEIGASINYQRNGITAVMYSPNEIDWMKDLGFRGDSLTKTVPEFVSNLSNRQIGLFLKGLFSAAAGFRRTCIAYVTASSDLADHVCILLRRLRIQYSRRVNTAIRGLQKHTMNEIQISRRSYAEFQRKIGFLQEDKNARLALVARASNQFDYRYIITAKGRRFKVSNTIRGATLRRVRAVEEMDYCGFVYDFSVKGNENFVANNILVHNTWFGWPYMAEKEDATLKVIHTHHGGLNWHTPPPVPHANLVGISRFMAEIYKKQLGVEVRVVYNGIGLEAYPFTENRGERLLYLGRIARFKQPHAAVQVAKSAGIPIDILGGERFVEDFSYVAEVRDSCDGRDARYIGEVPDDIKINYLKNCRALLVPSRMREPFGLVAVEALATGRPVICLDDGALKEIVTSEVGFVCKDLAEMAQVLISAKDIELSPKACRSRAEMFTRRRMAQTYLSYYTEILPSGHGW